MPHDTLLKRTGFQLKIYGIGYDIFMFSRKKYTSEIIPGKPFYTTEKYTFPKSRRAYYYVKIINYCTCCLYKIS